MSEFDLQPNEVKLPCGCYAEKIDGNRLRITGQSFLCDESHRLFEAVPDPRGPGAEKGETT